MSDAQAGIAAILIVFLVTIGVLVSIIVLYVENIQKPTPSKAIVKAENDLARASSPKEILICGIKLQVLKYKKGFFWSTALSILTVFSISAMTIIATVASPGMGPWDVLNNVINKVGSWWDSATRTQSSAAASG